MRPVRFARHVLLGVTSSVAAWLIHESLASGSAAFKFSMATAYVAAALLGATFALGPIYYLRLRRAPVSTYLRRDISIWAGLFALVHVAFGLQVHFAGRMWAYFIDPSPEAGAVPIRYDAFGLTNYLGAAAAVIIAILLAVSNDASMRRLGMDRWKSLQRTAYLGGAIIVAHSVIFQLLEKRDARFVVAFATVVAAVLTLRALSLWSKRDRRRV